MESTKNESQAMEKSEKSSSVSSSSLSSGSNSKDRPRGGVIGPGRLCTKVADFSEQKQRWVELVKKNLSEMNKEGNLRAERLVQYTRFVRAMKRLGFHDSQSPGLDDAIEQVILEEMLKEGRAERTLQLRKFLKAVYIKVPNDGTMLLPIIGEFNLKFDVDGGDYTRGLDEPNPTWIAEYLADFKKGLVPTHVMIRPYAHLLHQCIIDNSAGGDGDASLVSPEDIWGLLDEDIKASMTVDSVRFYLTQLLKHRALTGDPTAIIPHSDRIPFLQIKLYPFSNKKYASYMTWHSESARVSALVGRKVYVFMPKPIYSCCRPPSSPLDATQPQDHSHPHRKVVIRISPDGLPYCHAGDDLDHDDRDASNVYQDDFRPIVFTVQPGRLLEVVFGGAPYTEPVHGHGISHTKSLAVFDDSRKRRREFCVRVAPKSCTRPRAQHARFHYAGDSKGISVDPHLIRGFHCRFFEDFGYFEPSGTYLCTSLRMARMEENENFLLHHFYAALDEAGRDPEAVYKVMTKELTERRCYGTVACTMEMVEWMLRSPSDRLERQDWSFHQLCHLVKAVDNMGGGDPFDERVTENSLLKPMEEVDDGFNNITVETVGLHLTILRQIWKELPIDQSCYSVIFQPMAPPFASC